MLRHLRLLWLFAKVSVQNDAAYRAELAMQGVTAVIQVGASLVQLWVIYSNTRELNGWGPNHLLTLMGVFELMQGVIHFAIAPNMRMIMEDVQQGTLDFVLLKPVNHQFYVSARRVPISRVVGLFTGSAMAITGAIRLSGSIPLSSVMLFLLTLAAGSVIIYSFWLILATLSFWLVRVQNLEMVFWNVYEAGRYPVTIYGPGIRTILTYVFPVAFVVTIPAQALVGATGGPVGALNFATWGAAVVVAPVMLLIASAFWRYGLRHYSGASA